MKSRIVVRTYVYWPYWIGPGIRIYTRDVDCSHCRSLAEPSVQGKKSGCGSLFAKGEDELVGRAKPRRLHCHFYCARTIGARRCWI